MPLPSRLAITTLLAGSLLGGIASSAAAASSVFVDKKGDAHGHADIRRAKVTFNDQFLTVRIKIKANENEISAFRLYFDTPKVEGKPNLQFAAVLGIDTGFSFSRTRGWKPKPDRGGYCPELLGGDVRFDLDGDFTTIGIPTSCFGEAKKIRVGLVTFREDPKSKFQKVDWLLGKRELTPWVRR